MRQYLLNRREEIPEWLRNHKVGDRVNINDFLQSRVLYYPGAGDDGEPVRTLVSTHCAHCFIYVDYFYSNEDRLNNIDINGFRGYRLIDEIEIHDFLSTRDEWIAWRGTYPYDRHFDDTPFRFSVSPEITQCTLAIFEREPMSPPWLADYYGAERFAVLFVQGDGIFAYEKIFGHSKKTPPPFMLLLQDHGLGGNYDTFGSGGLLEKVARRIKRLPDYIFEGNNGYGIWEPNYTKINTDAPEYGGIHHNKRMLWRRKRNAHHKIQISFSKRSVPQDGR